MYLKALEIQGFKSFPDKTRLTFEKAITAIVGPNGSGKSNISDAILWVMGEQRTKTLRGGKMEDVIFGGTEKRSAMGFAQVSLILDNADHSLPLDQAEVMLTRRYYRSGESEYYINKESVRLKDINELLMDTGLGREGYSVIGQGCISEIVSAKSTDRRQVFEEAAGISRFRHRKEESERKLQRTEENLQRIRDKIDELELQVGPLRQQAEVAKQYLVLRDQLRVEEVSLWMENLDRVREQAQLLQADYENAEAELAAAHKELDALYAGAENYAQRMREKDLEAESARELLRQTEASAAESESALAVLRANRKNNDDSLLRLQSELSEQENRTRGLEEQIARHRARVEEIQAGLAELAAALEGLQAQAEENAAGAGKAQAALSEKVNRENACGEALARCQAALTHLADAEQDLLDRDTAIRAERAAAGEKDREAQEALAGARKQLAEARERESSLRNVISGYQLRRASRQEKAAALAQKNTQLTIDLGAMDSRIQMLREMEKEYEGFSKAVKAVMREAERGALRGVRGPVAKLIHAEDRYALAIETALGAAMQHIVVETSEQGKAAIEFLKRRDAGRCTFLPLSAIRPGSLKRLPEEEAGYLGVASRLCRYDPGYENLVSNLLGRTVIAETLADAVRLGKKYDHAFRVVSLDGQVVNAGGSMTGGSAARGTGFLSRANECRRLEQQRAALAEQAEETRRQLQEAQRDLEKVEYEGNVAQTQLGEARDDVLKSEAAVNQWELLLHSARESLDALETEAESLSARAEENQRRIQENRLESGQLEQELETLRREIREMTAGQEDFTRKREALQDRMAENREAAASLEAEAAALEKSMDQLAQLRQELTGDSRSRQETMAGLRERNRDLETELSQRQARLTELQEKIRVLQERIAAVTSQRLELEGKRNQAEKAGQEKNRALLELERGCAQLEQKKLSADLEEKQLLDKLWDTYELSHSAAQAIRQPVESVPKASRQVAERKKEISALGNPNLGAIEEYERVNTRFTFLSEQRSDVEKAKKELEEIIGDITREMREIFSREFQAIDARFRTTFRELFGGGHASLALEDDSDVLECGVEIKVQPPGKALSTISLLSGGEKAFVAIALYFAILQVRPAPFCLMDEIEAALDEVNVIRYAEYMRTLSHKTQFIVITHRRGTMEEADMLYGVTMQEKGVTRIISMDLEEAEKTITT